MAFCKTNEKKFGLIILLCGLIILFGISCLEKSREVFFDNDEKGNFVVSIRVGEETQQLYPYYDVSSDSYYIFLPAFIKDHRIYNDSLKMQDLTIDGKRVLPFHSMQWEEDRVYSIAHDAVGGGQMEC